MSDFEDESFGQECEREMNPELSDQESESYKWNLLMLAMRTIKYYTLWHHNQTFLLLWCYSNHLQPRKY